MNELQVSSAIVPHGSRTIRVLCDGYINRPTFHCHQLGPQHYHQLDNHHNSSFSGSGVGSGLGCFSGLGVVAWAFFFLPSFLGLDRVGCALFFCGMLIRSDLRIEKKLLMSTAATAFILCVRIRDTYAIHQ